MDRILISLKKENSPRASSAPALGLNTIIFKHVYWYMQQTQVSVYRTIGPLVFYLLLNVPFNRYGHVGTCLHIMRLTLQSNIWDDMKTQFVVVFQI